MILLDGHFKSEFDAKWIAETVDKDRLDIQTTDV